MWYHVLVVPTYTRTHLKRRDAVRSRWLYTERAFRRGRLLLRRIVARHQLPVVNFIRQRGVIFEKARIRFLNSANNKNSYIDVCTHRFFFFFFQFRRPLFTDRLFIANFKPFNFCSNSTPFVSEIIIAWRIYGELAYLHFVYIDTAIQVVRRVTLILLSLLFANGTEILPSRFARPLLRSAAQHQSEFIE